MGISTTKEGLKMDRELKEKLFMFIDLASVLITLGSFIQVFIFCNQDWFGAMLLCLAISCFLPLFD